MEMDGDETVGALLRWATQRGAHFSPSLAVRDGDAGRGVYCVTAVRSGDLLLIQRDNGQLVMARASRAGYEPIVEAPLLRGETRAYPALADGIWFARDERELVAVDLRPR